MRNILKAATLESKFPVLSVERGCILSKDADVTVGFKVRLPELFTLTSAEYAAMHGTWVKAIKVLPCYTVVHRQDWFPGGKIQGRNWPGRHGIPGPQLRTAFQRASLPEPLRLPVHYPDYPRKKPAAEQLLHPLPGAIIPREARDREAVVRFMESVDQFGTHHGRFRAGGA